MVKHGAGGSIFVMIRVERFLSTFFLADLPVDFFAILQKNIRLAGFLPVRVKNCSALQVSHSAPTHDTKPQKIQDFMSCGTRRRSSIDCDAGPCRQEKPRRKESLHCHHCATH
jgi:hypothetical protein